MKLRVFALTTLSLWQINAHAADLIEVYKQAQLCDPTFQQAVAQRLSTKEGVPISLAAILPNLSVSANPTVSRYGYAGTNYDTVTGGSSGSFVLPRNLTQRTYTLNLSLNQTIFNFAQFYTVEQQLDLSKAADATLNAALQNLMVRVANAYFSILKDEDNLSYANASKIAFAEQLDQIKQQYNVGLKTQTDVYTAKASYDMAVSTYISAETTLSNDRENLRVITGVYYPHLSALSEDFPLLSPEPRDINQWVETAQRHNWQIAAQRYNVASLRQVVKAQMAGHLPTVTLEGSLSRQYAENINGYATFSQRNGPGTTNDKAIGLDINVPLFAGGGVIAQTNQAVYNYQVAQQQLELTFRNTINATRQSYMNIVSGISQVDADKQAVKSTISSLDGLEASYRVGTETLVDVLNQQQKVFQAQTQYATDRYAFVNNVLALKQAAGTLSFADLCGINVWLTDKEKQPLSAPRKHIAAISHTNAKKHKKIG